MTAAGDRDRHPAASRYMTEPGEPLEVASSVLRSAVRHRVWATDTGIDPVWMRPEPAVLRPAAHLPAMPGRPVCAAGRGVRAAMMWHPLLWLPDRLATRYTLVDDDGTCSTEPDDIWCLRVCLELQAAGMLRPGHRNLAGRAVTGRAERRRPGHRSAGSTGG